jgi:hypothetical protein
VAEALRVTRYAFISAEEFSKQHDVNSKDLPKILKFSEDSSTDPPLQFLSAPGKASDEPDEAGYPYIHTLTSLLKLQKDVLEKVSASVEEKR